MFSFKCYENIPRILFMSAMFHLDNQDHLTHGRKHLSEVYLRKKPHSTILYHHTSPYVWDMLRVEHEDSDFISQGLYPNLVCKMISCKFTSFLIYDCIALISSTLSLKNNTYEECTSNLTDIGIIRHIRGIVKYSAQFIQYYEKRK